MTRVRLTGIKKAKNRLGVRYHYVRGVPGAFWSSASKAKEGGPEYLAALAEKAKELRGEAARGTTAEMVDLYLDSKDFSRLGARTQADYRKHALAFAAKFGRMAVKGWEDPRSRGALIAWRDGLGAGDKQSDYAVTVAALILGWARDRSIIGLHHCDKIKKLYRSDRAAIMWAPDHVAAFMAAAPEPARLILTVAMETGMRAGDVAKFSRQHVQATPQGRRVLVPTNKSRGRQFQAVPVSDALAAVIDSAPAGRDLILVSERGKPLTANRVSQYIGQWMAAAGLPDELHLHDLRGTAAARLLRAGADLKEIASAMGWSIRTAAQMIEIYARLDPSMSDGLRAKLETRLETQAPERS